MRLKITHGDLKGEENSQFYNFICMGVIIVVVVVALGGGSGGDDGGGGGMCESTYSINILIFGELICVFCLIYH